MTKMKKTRKKIRKEVKCQLLILALFIVLISVVADVNATPMAVAPAASVVGATKKPEMVKVDVEKKGIDVSKWNGKIDWSAVKKSGIDFAIIRVGYGDNISAQDDEWATYNMSECMRVGIPFGVYIYSYALDESGAQSEAEHVLRMIDGYKLSYPIYLDMEDASTQNLGSKELGQIAFTFVSAINTAGYEVGVYSNTDWFNNVLTDPVFDTLTRWCAQYNDTCSYTGTYTMWQYSKSGTVPGISTSVDMNVSYETEWIEK